MTRSILLYVLILQLVGCKSKMNDSKVDYFDKTYEGMWAETLWIYNFENNGRFVLKADGHYAMAEYGGSYTIADSMIFLNPDSDWQLFDGVLKSRLKIVSPYCLRDFENNFYCLTLDSVSKLNEYEFEFQATATSILDTLPLTKDVMSRYKRNDDNGSLNSELKIYYDGIVVDKKRELHLFRLQRYDWEKDRTITYESYLINKKPFEIYLHTLRRDSLIMLYKRDNWK